MPPEPEIDLLDASRITQRLLRRTCAWCGTEVPYSGRGRPRRYCGKSCHDRSWEVRSAEARLRRDIAAGTASTEPVREVIRETVTERRTRLIAAAPPSTAPGWIAHLEELVRQLTVGELAASTGITPSCRAPCTP
ncbi:hypothetical protein [Streptosporangium sp. NPDC000396]|uniref:hypothetical protein n=1 Tax=Streptosporangium sp. NPDC000396 TaxID=3366185 RepID=UPI0036C0A7DC